MDSESSRKVVEQFHHKKLYALKGGCNLRFYFNSIRYSEDMDLDIQTIALQTLRNKVNQILNSDSFQRIMAVRDITLRNYSEPKQTETTQRWKLDLRLPNSSIMINTRIEFSRREQIESAVFEPIQTEIIQNYRLTPIFSSHYPVLSAYQQKIRALVFRKQTQARDVFDLYVLLSRKDLNLMNVADEVKSLFHQAQTQAMSITFDDFKGQVLAYLPFELQRQYDDSQVWDLIVLKVCEAFGA